MLQTAFWVAVFAAAVVLMANILKRLSIGLELPGWIQLAIVAVLLWILMDYVDRVRRRKAAECNAHKPVSKPASQRADPIVVRDTIDDIIADWSAPDKHSNASNKRESFVSDDPRVADDKHRSPDAPITVQPEGCVGDDKLCNRMLYTGMQGQMSKVIRSHFNKYNLQPYFEEELREASAREWWNSDFLESEM